MVPTILVVIAVIIVLFTDEHTRGFCWAILIISAIGAIIKVIISENPIRKRRSKSLEEALEEIFYMNGFEFEHYCGELLSKNGYHSINVTQGSGDFGADITAKQNGEKYVIQCKKYSKNIGIKAVQEVYAAKQHYNADYAVVLTNVYFTPAAQKLAAETGVLLWDRERLCKMIESTLPSTSDGFCGNQEMPRWAIYIFTAIGFLILITTLILSVPQSSNSSKSAPTTSPTKAIVYEDSITSKNTAVTKATPSPNPTKRPIIAKVVKEGVNIRKEPSAESDRIGYAVKGDKLQVIKEYYTEKWHQILYEGQICYVAAYYCEIESN